MALVEQLEYGRWWYVQLAAMWHWCYASDITSGVFNFVLRHICHYVSIPFIYFSFIFYQ